MRFVLDTCILVSAIRSANGPSRQLLKLVLQGRLNPLVSVPLMAEYEAVMTRPEHLARARLSRNDVTEILDAMTLYIERVPLWFSIRPATKDANDDMVLETAVNGRADALITENIEDFKEGALRYGIQVLKPSAALHSMTEMKR
ncbi:hypothetical protein VZ95_06860 [Elstera litoralis]|uniref:PIN domain-containing protein n=2 Tax=Elstera litoralis TaxID=552518 RepID=A0A0F3IU46_9PROT|nr:putative toxin-antitoxin system toxin component, PIN family [Elstera litoralis]KJV10147.1 hypothetical protein VZ95_06860 [Elstera litoralis]